MQILKIIWFRFMHILTLHTHTHKHTYCDTSSSSLHPTTQTYFTFRLFRIPDKLLALPLSFSRKHSSRHIQVESVIYIVLPHCRLSGCACGYRENFRVSSCISLIFKQNGARSFLFCSTYSWHAAIKTISYYASCECVSECGSSFFIFILLYFMYSDIFRNSRYIFLNPIIIIDNFVYMKC